MRYITCIASKKEARSKMQEAGVNRGSAFEVFSENRNMARNIIDAVNLWIENSLLFQENLKKEYDKRSFNLNQELCIKCIFMELHLKHFL